jgi:serine/threonine-protein kinase
VVSLTPRLFDTLLYLVQNPERLVTRDELENAVWGGRVVEEGNLQKAISSLRKALLADGAAAGLIVTVPGRGFRFAVPVEFEPEAAEAAVPALLASTAISASATSPRPARLRLAWAAAGLGAAAVAVAFGVSWYHASRPAPFAPPPHSVAVMAFTNLSGDRAQEYFSDGLSEELIDGLGRIGGLRVPARLSSFSFKGKSATAPEIARKLDVGAVLEGSVRRNGKRLRITAQLVDGRTGYAIWSLRFDRDQADILKVQEEIAGAVMQSLQLSLLGEAATQFGLGGTDNAAAFDAYLRARKLGMGDDVPAYKAELAALGEALRLDTNYAMARTRRALLLRFVSDTESTADADFPAATLDLALQEADRAISLAPDLGLAHAARGEIMAEMLVFDAAAAELSRALQLAPNDGDTARVAAINLFELAPPASRMQALESVKRAASLDPLSANGYLNLVVADYLARRYDDALAAQRHAAELLPAMATMDMFQYGAIEIAKGNAEAARGACARERDFAEEECLALAYAALGKPLDSAAHLAKAQAVRGDNDAFAYAEIFAQSGNQTEALRWLDTAFLKRSSMLMDICNNPLLDPVRDTPHFDELVRRLNFPR